MGFPKPSDGIREIMRERGIEPLHRYLTQEFWPLMNKVIDADGSIIPASLADADAKNNRIYFSTDAGVLVYKDSSGVVNNLHP